MTVKISFSQRWTKKNYPRSSSRVKDGIWFTAGEKREHWGWGFEDWGTGLTQTSWGAWGINERLNTWKKPWSPRSDSESINTWWTQIVQLVSSLQPSQKHLSAQIKNKQERGLPHSSDGRESACNAGEIRVQSLGQIPWIQDPLDKEMAIHSSIPAWRIPWTEGLAGYTPWGHKESNMTKWLTHIRFL